MKISKSIKSFIKRLKERKKAGIRFKLVAAFLVPIILIAILGIVSYIKSSNAVYKIAQSSTSATIDVTSKYIQSTFSSINDTMMQILLDSDIKNFLSSGDEQTGSKKDFLATFKEKQQIEQRITSFITSNKNIADISIIAEENNSITPSSIYKGITIDKLKDTELAKKIQDAGNSPVWVGRHIELDKLSGTDSVSSNAESKYYSAVLRAMRDYDTGEIKAYVVIDLDSKYMNEFMSGICKNLGAGSELHLISPDKEDFFSQADNKVSNENITDQKFYNDMLASKNTNGSATVSYLGRQYLASYSKLTDNGYILIGMIPVSSLNAASQSIAIVTIIIVIIAILIAFGIGIYIANGMSKAINGIINTAGHAAAGDLTAISITNREDEFGILTQSINSMIENMRQLVNRIVGITQKVTNSALTVSTTSENVSSISRNISYAIQEISQGATAQAADAELGAQKISLLANKINNVTKNAKVIDGLTKGTMEITQVGLDSIENLKKKSSETTSIARDIMANVNELDSHSKSIEKVVGVIKGIADQTNLLALNAAIEAARAGEMGRGFSVVADEVRKLAEQSVKATQEITSIIKDTQNKTAKAVEKAESTEAIMESQNDAVKSTTEIFIKIIGSMEDLTDQVDQIMSEIVEMEEHKENAINSIESISAVSEETASSSEEVTASTQEQLSFIEELADYAQDLGHAAQELERSILIFKIK